MKKLVMICLLSFYSGSLLAQDINVENSAKTLIHSGSAYMFYKLGQEAKKDVAVQTLKLANLNPVARAVFNENEIYYIEDLIEKEGVTKLKVTYTPVFHGNRTKKQVMLDMLDSQGKSLKNKLDQGKITAAVYKEEIALVKTQQSYIAGLVDEHKIANEYFQRTAWVKEVDAAGFRNQVEEMMGGATKWEVQAIEFAESKSLTTSKSIFKYSKIITTVSILNVGLQLVSMFGLPDSEDDLNTQTSLDRIEGKEVEEVAKTSQGTTVNSQLE